MRSLGFERDITERVFQESAFPGSKKAGSHNLSFFLPVKGHHFRLLEKAAGSRGVALNLHAVTAPSWMAAGRGGIAYQDFKALRRKTNEARKVMRWHCRSVGALIMRCDSEEGG